MRKPADPSGLFFCCHVPVTGHLPTVVRATQSHGRRSRRTPGEQGLWHDWKRAGIGYGNAPDSQGARDVHGKDRIDYRAGQDGRASASWKHIGMGWCHPSLWNRRPWLRASTPSDSTIPPPFPVSVHAAILKSRQLRHARLKLLAEVPQIVIGQHFVSVHQQQVLHHP